MIKATVQFEIFDTKDEVDEFKQKMSDLLKDTVADFEKSFK